MTETASSLITDALGEILVQASEQPIEPNEMSSAIRYLNRMMAGFSANGIDLGYTIVTNQNDVITVPPGASEGVLFNLAIRLAQQYDEQISPTLAASAAAGLSALRKLGLTLSPAKPPCTLPIGSGNESDGSGGIGDRFYPCPDESILTEDNGNILVESGT